MRSAQQATTTTTGLLPGNDCSAAFFFIYLHFWPREMRRASSLGLLHHPSDDCLLYQNGRPGNNNNNNNKKKLFRVDVLQLAADYVAVSADSAGNISDLNVISFQFHRPRIGLFLATAHSSDGRPAFVSPNFNPLVGRLNFTGSPLKRRNLRFPLRQKMPVIFQKRRGGFGCGVGGDSGRKAFISSVFLVFLYSGALFADCAGDLLSPLGVCAPTGRLNGGMGLLKGGKWSTKQRNCRSSGGK